MRIGVQIPPHLLNNPMVATILSDPEVIAAFQVDTRSSVAPPCRWPSPGSGVWGGGGWRQDPEIAPILTGCFSNPLSVLQYITHPKIGPLVQKRRCCRCRSSRAGLTPSNLQ